MPYSTSIAAIISAARSLFRNRRSLLLIVSVYAALLASIYLFVSTREATIFQLLLTFGTLIAAPALFFVLQAAIVGFTDGPTSRGLIKGSVKLFLISVPVIVLIFGAIHGLNKFQAHPTIMNTLRYLLLAVIAPLLIVQLWIAAGTGGVIGSLHKVLARTFAPQSLFVYVCGFLIFAGVPYFLLQKTFPAQRPWLEVSLFAGRIGITALLILLGWMTTVGALSILSRNHQETS